MSVKGCSTPLDILMVRGILNKSHAGTAGRDAGGVKPWYILVKLLGMIKQIDMNFVYCHLYGCRDSNQLQHNPLRCLTKLTMWDGLTYSWYFLVQVCATICFFFMKVVLWFVDVSALSQRCATCPLVKITMTIIRIHYKIAWLAMLATARCEVSAACQCPACHVWCCDKPGHCYLHNIGCIAFFRWSGLCFQTILVWFCLFVFYFAATSGMITQFDIIWPPYVSSI